MTEHRCPQCEQELKPGERVCSHCGWVVRSHPFWKWLVVLVIVLPLCLYLGGCFVKLFSPPD